MNAGGACVAAPILGLNTVNIATHTCGVTVKDGIMYTDSPRIADLHP